MSDNTPGNYPGHAAGEGNQSKYPAGQQWQPPAPGQQPNSPYGAPGGYGTPYGHGAPGGYGQPVENPGRTMGIVGLVCSIIWPISIVGLVISIIAFVKSKKANMGNGVALAGIIIGAIGVITGVIAVILGIAALSFATEVVEFCSTAGPGVQEFQGQPIDCSQFLQ